MKWLSSGLNAVWLAGRLLLDEVSMVSKKARAAAACAGLGGCWPQVCLAVLFEHVEVGVRGYTRRNREQIFGMPR